MSRRRNQHVTTLLEFSRVVAANVGLGASQEFGPTQHVVHLGATTDAYYFACGDEDAENENVQMLRDWDHLAARHPRAGRIFFYCWVTTGTVTPTDAFSPGPLLQKQLSALNEHGCD